MCKKMEPRLKISITSDMHCTSYCKNRISTYLQQLNNYKNKQEISYFASKIR